MSDLIDKQAAIRIIQSMYPGMPRIPCMRKDWQERYAPFIRTENAIRELPSALPELKCSGCIYEPYADICERCPRMWSDKYERRKRRIDEQVD